MKSNVEINIFATKSNRQKILCLWISLITISGFLFNIQNNTNIRSTNNNLYGISFLILSIASFLNLFLFTICPNTT